MTVHFNFDEEGIGRQILEAAAQRIREIAEATKQEMGEQGAGIMIETKEFISGNETSLGGITFPSEEVKDEFMKRFTPKLQ